MGYVHDLVNKANPVNIARSYGSSLEREMAEALRGIFSPVQWLKSWTVETLSEATRDQGWDLRASWPVAGGRKAVLYVECKRNFQPNQFSLLAKRFPRELGHNKAATRALAMPRVSDRMAAICKENGWSWFDASGNCRLDIPGLLYIERLGLSSSRRVVEVAGANLSTPEAARVIRALLAPESAGRRWTQRAMVEHFARLTPRIPPPSLALVNKVIQHLRNEAFVQPAPNRGFYLRDPEGLLQEWRQAYRFGRHMRRRYFTLLKGHSIDDNLRRLNPNGQRGIAYAAFSAADVQAPNVRQGRTWLFVDADLEAEFAEAVDAKIVDSGENLVVLIPDDPGVFYRMEVVKGRLAATNPVQTYVDLAHVGGRGLEAAESVHQQRLRSAWSGS